MRGYNDTREVHETETNAAACYKIVFVFFFFVRSNVVWNTVKMNMAFCKPTDGHLSRNTRIGKAKPCLFQ